ncbi:MAG: DMT family transporter [Pseudomonadota bacterium]|nr:DMT family transporter [Pseudomonadota bacterium]
MQRVPIRQPLDLRAVALVLLLCVVWGVQQVVMKSVVSDVPPVMQLAVRFAGAAVFFGLLVAKREGRRALADGSLWSGLSLGLLFSLEFVFAGSALVHTTAAHSIVFLYSAPIFTALGLQFLPEERLDRIQWAGIAAAFFGIVVAFVGPGSRTVGELLVGDLLALAGGAAWGLSNVVLRRGRVGSAATAKTVLYQVGVAAPVLYAFARLTGQTRVVPSEAALFALGFQTLFISIFSYLVWFWLLRHYLTSRLMLLSLMTPLFGVLLGALLLGDPIEPRFALGSLLVLAGILVVNGRLLRSPAV